MVLLLVDRRIRIEFYPLRVAESRPTDLLSGFLNCKLDIGQWLGDEVAFGSFILGGMLKPVMWFGRRRICRRGGQRGFSGCVGFVCLFHPAECPSG